MPSKKQPTAAKTATTTTDAASAEVATTTTTSASTVEAKMEANVTDLGRARELPEVPGGQVVRLDPLTYAEGSIEQFADEDGRTMRIVAIAEVLHKYPVPDAITEEA